MNPQEALWNRINAIENKVEELKASINVTYVQLGQLSEHIQRLKAEADRAASGVKKE